MAEDIARPFNSGQERDPHLQSPLCGGRAYCPCPGYGVGRRRSPRWLPPGR